MRAKPQITILACLALASCVSTGSGDAKRPVELASPRAQPPAALERPCAGPARLAGKALSAGAVERLWGKDRVSLAECGAKHGALVRWRRSRDAGLAGEKLPEPPAQDEAPSAAAIPNPFAALFGANASEE